MNILEELPFLKARTDYQRSNFDKFLSKISFSYNIPSIHITGTNGKGSTATYIASIYKEAGYKVGLFVSPYFNMMNEMISVNKENIHDEELTEIVDKYKKYFEKYDLSEFEVETFIAFTHFMEEKVDIAVIECGMGGALDATNIFTPILSIITSVSLEHTEYLGKSVAEIAYSKAGIIKQEVPVLIGELDKEAEATITSVADDTNSKIFKVATPFDIKHTKEGISFSYREIKDVLLDSNAKYAVKNAAIALEAIDILKTKFTVFEVDIKKALASVHMINRLEVLMEKPLVIIDGAHNVEAIHELVQSIFYINKNKAIHTVFASFRDKNIALMLPELALLSEDLSLTTFDHPRARKEEEYFLFSEEYKFYDDYLSLIKNKMKEYPDDLILITGSLAFVSRVRNDYNMGKLKNE